MGRGIRYPLQKSYPHSVPEVDALPNWWWITSPDPDSTLLPVKIDTGIDAIASIRAPDGWRVPAINLRSSPGKSGSSTTPWQNVLRADQGWGVYYGDSRANRDTPSHETEGNRVMLEAFRLHASGEREQRAKAAPILIFEGYAVPGRPKGQVRFLGLSVIRGVEHVVQQDPKTGCEFANYRYELTILDLVEDEDALGWEWINARRNPRSTAADAARLSPKVWSRWVEGGDAALHRLQRRVLKRSVIPTARQHLVDEPDVVMLREIHRRYQGRGHRFESLASFVLNDIMQEAGIDYRPGWITPRGGDGGVDFVARIDLDPKGAFPSSRQVLLGQAKCESPGGTTSGRDIARLVARLRRGWVGAYVTTATFSDKVQLEILEDRYPLTLVNGQRLVQVLRRQLGSSGGSLQALLDNVDSAYETATSHRDYELVLDY